MKKFIALTAALLLCAGAPITMIGCKSPRVVAYNTLYSVEKVTVAAYDGYCSEVIKGTVATNSVPQVSLKYNQFQLGYLLALDAAQWNTNTLAPDGLIRESNDIINLINSFRKK